MNPELLKLYTALQPFFRERMGEWPLLGDKAWDGKEIYVFARKRWNGYRCTYEFYSVDGRSFETSRVDYLLIFPRTIDDSSPEAQKRSLWGMVDWNRWNIAVDGTNSITYIVNIIGKGGDIEGATPTEAILRALCAQEGVEI